MTKKVYLIGAGCGEMDLITLRGFKKLQEADVVLYDSLIDEKLLENLSNNVEKIFVGKRHNQKSISQDEINKLIIKLAKENKTIARLKGGDAFVFARGAEEIEAIKKENIPYEIIPGITSAVAVPELAGIPLTHRQLSRNFCVLTGSITEDNKEKTAPIDYASLTKLNGTIVLLMAYHHIDEIMENFIKAGMDKNMPCAVISQGCSSKQKIIKGNIKNIVSKLKKENIKTPIVIVIGKCCNFDLKTKANSGKKDNKKNDFENLKIAICGTKNFYEKLNSLIKLKKAKTIDLSFLDVISINTKLPKLQNYSWIVFTSQNGIEQFFLKLKKEKIDIRQLFHLKFATMGSGTEKKLQEYGFYSDLTPKEYSSEFLAKELLLKTKKDDKILILRAKEGSKTLTNTLRVNNYKYKDFKLYELKENKEKINTLLSLNINSFNTDYLVFGSAKGVTTFFDNFDFDFNSKTKFVCIGKTCAKALEKYPAKKILIAKKYDVDGIIECMEKDFKKAKNEKIKKTETK